MLAAHFSHFYTLAAYAVIFLTLAHCRCW